MHPTETKVTSIRYASKGVETLTPNQRNILAHVLGFKPESELNGLGAAEFPSKLENAITSKLDTGDVDHWLSNDITIQTSLAQAFELKPTSELTHVGQIEQRALIARTLSELVAR